MAYLTLQDLLDELGGNTLAQLTNDDGGDTVNEARVQAVIENAQGVFESYIRGRYSLPVRITPLVKSLNLDLAIFNLYKRMPLAEGVYTVRENAYKAAMQTLKDIAGGKAALDVPAAEETVDNPSTSDRILTNASKSKFTDDKLSSF